MVKEVRVKAKDVPMASKLRVVLSEILKAGKLTPEDLISRFDGLISKRAVIEGDIVISEMNDLMTNYLKKNIMSPDEMQFIIDEAIMIYRAGEDDGVRPLINSVGYIVDDTVPKDELKIN